MQQVGTVIVSVVRKGYVYMYYYDEHVFNTIHVKTNSQDMTHAANRVEKYCECGQCLGSIKDRYASSSQEPECPVCDKKNICT